MGAAIVALSVHLLAVRLNERRHRRAELWPSVLGALLTALPTLLFVVLVARAAVSALLDKASL